jgi:hypothetical protein
MELTTEQMRRIYEKGRLTRNIGSISYDDNLVTLTTLVVSLWCKLADEGFWRYVLQVEYRKEDPLTGELLEYNDFDIKPEGGGEIMPDALPDLKFSLRSLSQLQMTLGGNAYIIKDSVFLGDCIAAQVVDSMHVRFYRRSGGICAELMVGKLSYDYCVPEDDAEVIFGKTGSPATQLTQP